jgi:hypothetical protein
MDKDTATALIDNLIQEITIEINGIKAQIAGDMIMQVAIYSYDHVGADRKAFGVLSDSPTVDKEYLEETEQVRAVLLDREQRRNALKHLGHLIREGNVEALRLLQQELQRFFSKDETYAFFLEPETEHPNEYVKPYSYS